MNKKWLPEGHHWGLHIEHDRGGDAGAFTGGGWKMCWHITVSPWLALDTMVDVLKAKHAEPHLVIGGRRGVQNPVVVQMVPFDRAGRSVQHTLPPETNRANLIQVEICATPGSSLALAGARMEAADDRFGHDLFALPGFELEMNALGFSIGQEITDLDTVPLCMDRERHGEFALASFKTGVASWGEETYKALANLTALVEHRVPIPRQLARRFTNTQRFSGEGFVKAQGHLGHQHVPGNTHFDPTTDFKGSHLLKLAGEGQQHF